MSRYKNEWYVRPRHTNNSLYKRNRVMIFNYRGDTKYWMPEMDLIFDIFIQDSVLKPEIFQSPFFFPSGLDWIPQKICLLSFIPFPTNKPIPFETVASLSKLTFFLSFSFIGNPHSMKYYHVSCTIERMKIQECFFFKQCIYWYEIVYLCPRHFIMYIHVKSIIRTE